MVARLALVGPTPWFEVESWFATKEAFWVWANETPGLCIVYPSGHLAWDPTRQHQ